MRGGSFRFLSGVVMAVTGLAAQASERLLSFEVASVKQNTSGDARTQMRTLPVGRLVVTNAPLRGLIAEAFAMADPQSLIPVRILGGPG